MGRWGVILDDDREQKLLRVNVCNLIAIEADPLPNGVEAVKDHPPIELEMEDGHLALTWLRCGGCYSTYEGYMTENAPHLPRL